MVYVAVSKLRQNLLIMKGERERETKEIDRETTDKDR